MSTPNKPEGKSGIASSSQKASNPALQVKAPTLPTKTEFTHEKDNSKSQDDAKSK